MKNRVNGLVAIILFFIVMGCRETPPFIDFSKKEIALKDTTYLLSTPPIPAPKKIYIEDITGVRCPNCPKAAIKIHEIDSMNPGNVVALALYPYYLTFLTTPYPGYKVLNTAEADYFYTNIYNSPSTIPGGSINRKEYPGETELNAHFNKWIGHTEILKTEQTPIVLKTKVIKEDTTNNKFTINTQIAFSSNYADEVYLSIFVSENNIVSPQSMPIGGVNQNYVHNHVLRMGITSGKGEPLKITQTIIGNYEAGRVFEKDFNIVIEKDWVRKNCKIIAIVSRFDTNSKEVLQAIELDLH